VTITPVNDPPVANADSTSTPSGVPVTKNVVANDTDPDGDPLTISSSTNGANGTVVCSGSNCTYTSAAAFIGTDFYTYTISDGAGGSATATVSVTVVSVNAPPNANDDNVTAQEGRPISINVLANDSDPDGDPLTITSFTQGAKGSVNCAGTSCSYRSASGQSGSDSFTYKISDGKGGTDTATVRINIIACPVSPVTLNPQDGATNVPTSGNLSYASGASNHTVYFGPAGGGCSTAYFDTLNSQVPYSNLQPGTEYEWRVEGREPGCPTVNSSCVRFRTAGSPCPAAPTPIQPAAGSTVQSPVTFTWSAVSGATIYKVFVSVNGAPATAVGSTATTTLIATVGDGSIRWFVVASVPACADLQSATVSFNACNAPGQPLAGVVGESTSEQTYAVSWLEVPGANRYEVQEATNAAFTDAQTFDTAGTSVSFTKTAATARPFFYRVRAFGACFGAFGSFSPVIRVVIVPVPPREEPDTDTTVPTGSRRPVVLQVFIAGEPNQTLRYTATVDKPWMRVDPPSGSLPPDGVTLNVTADPTDQPNGTITGTVIVTILDTSGSRQVTHATTTKQVPVSINLVTPVLPIGSGTPPATSMIIPAVGHLDGSDARWRSDIRIANTSGGKLRYQLTLVPSDVTIGQKQTTIDIEAGATTALDDVVRAWYGIGSLGESSAGYLEVRPLTAQGQGLGEPVPNADTPNISLSTVVTSRTYSQTSAGTLGEFIPGIPFGSFVGRVAGTSVQQVLNLQQIAQNANFRTNVGVVEASGNAVSALLSIFDAAGTKLRDVPVELRANEQRQLNSLLAQQNITLGDGRIEVRVTGGQGKVTAYAAVVDNRSRDQLFVPPVALTNLLASKYVVPGIADLISGNAVWRSDLRIFNAGATAQNPTLTLYPQNNSGAPVTASISVNPGQVSILDNIVQSLFRTSNLGGAVHVDTPLGSSLVVTGRTYTPSASGGILGQFIEAVTPDEAVGAGERALNILQAEDSVRYRTNLGLAEVTGKPAVVEVTITLPDSKVSPVVRIPLAANEFKQFGILRELGMGNIYNARLSMRVISGEGRVTAYGSLIDMKTQDSTYVPAR
ncbi:MAG: Ig-like domain-containing protein, partial [Thermoanaerobaculia bacterium]